MATKTTILPFLGAFREELTAEAKSELKKIIRVPRPKNVSNHHDPVDASEYQNSGLKGVFYRLYFTKCVAKVRNEKISSGLLRDISCTFPFKITKNVMRKCPPVMRLFDDDFKREIEMFMKHIEEYQSHELLELFFANVQQIRLTHFDEKSMQKLKTFVEERRYESCTQYYNGGFINDFLESFPRLDADGIQRILRYQNQFHVIQNAYLETVFAKKPPGYFRFLPEINFYELFSLMDVDFYVSNREVYMDRLKKYLLFFGYAIDRPDHPVLFIDDILFQCMKFYPIYQQPMNDVLSEEDEYVLWMMALVRNRKKELMEFCQDLDLNREHFKIIMNHVKGIPGIETSKAILDLHITHELCQIRTKCKLIVGDTFYDFCFSNTKRNNKSFVPLLMRAALVSENIRRIVYYNAFLGTETSIMVPPGMDADIINFIRKYNKPTYSNPTALLFFPSDEFFEKI